MLQSKPIRPPRDSIFFVKTKSEDPLSSEIARVYAGPRAYIIQWLMLKDGSSDQVEEDEREEEWMIDAQGVGFGMKGGVNTVREFFVSRKSKVSRLL